MPRKRRHPALLLLIERLAALQADPDHESAHAAADALLLDYIGDAEVREAYDGIVRWYA